MYSMSTHTHTHTNKQTYMETHHQTSPSPTVWIAIRNKHTHMERVGILEDGTVTNEDKGTHEQKKTWQIHCFKLQSSDTLKKLWLWALALAFPHTTKKHFWGGIGTKDTGELECGNLSHFPSFFSPSSLLSPSFSPFYIIQTFCRKMYICTFTFTFTCMPTFISM
jgi:hypothetical protein